MELDMPCTGVSIFRTPSPSGYSTPAISWPLLGFRPPGLLVKESPRPWALMAPLCFQPGPAKWGILLAGECFPSAVLAFLRL